MSVKYCAWSKWCEWQCEQQRKRCEWQGKSEEQFFDLSGKVPVPFIMPQYSHSGADGWPVRNTIRLACSDGCGVCSDPNAYTELCAAVGTAGDPRPSADLR